MSTKERLLELTALTLDEKIDEMNDEQLETYVQTLGAFADSVSTLQEKVKESLSAKDYDTLLGNLSETRGLLSGVHADVLASGCGEQIDKLIGETPPEHEDLEDALDELMAAVLTLSIDIQMIVREPEEEAEAEEEAEDLDKEPEGEKSILAVDDATIFLNIIKTALHNTHYNLTCVTSGGAALNYLKEKRASLFILDIEMPGMNGFDLAKKIRESGRKAPIIFLTSNGTKPYVVKAMDSGGTDFVVKPIDKEQLLARIKKHIGE